MFSNISALLQYIKCLTNNPASLQASPGLVRSGYQPTSRSRSALGTATTPCSQHLWCSLLSHHNPVSFSYYRRRCSTIRFRNCRCAIDDTLHISNCNHPHRLPQIQYVAFAPVKFFTLTLLFLPFLGESVNFAIYVASIVNAFIIINAVAIRGVLLVINVVATVTVIVKTIALGLFSAIFIRVLNILIQTKSRLVVVLPDCVRADQLWYVFVADVKVNPWPCNRALICFLIYEWEHQSHRKCACGECDELF